MQHTATHCNTLQHNAQHYILCGALTDECGQPLTQAQHDHINQVMSEADVVYVTRTQKERFSDPAAAEAAKGSYVITAQTLTKAKPNMILMHPLPRVNEIHEECDLDPRSVYFRQAEHGMYVRMALLAVIAGKA